MKFYRKARVSDLLGRTLLSVVNKDNQMLVFTTKSGEIYAQYHDNDCCERVMIESIVGDLSDLIGDPLLRVEEAVSRLHPEGYTPNGYEDSYMWTFYKFATRKGYVDVRWLGESNGYYSESVDFAQFLAD